MFTRIDHMMICVPDLAQGVAQYRQLGFNVHPGGSHPGKGSHNAIAFNRDDYIELLAIRDRDECERYAASSPGHDGGLARFIDMGGGIRNLVVQSDDLERDVAAMRARGVDVSVPADGTRRTPDGLDLHWKIARLGAANPLPLIFIQHLTPDSVRRTQVPGGSEHPNGVHGLERAVVVTPDARATAGLYAHVLDMPLPPLQHEQSIMSDIALFPIGPVGLGIAQPCAPGPASDALEHRGAGPFLALYRTASLPAAALWMHEHGVAPLAHAVCSSGEHAMLAPPALAGGAYVGFVGPE